MVLSSKSISDFLANYYAMKELLEYDAELLNTVKAQKQEIEETLDYYLSDLAEVN